MRTSDIEHRKLNIELKSGRSLSFCSLMFNAGCWMEPKRGQKQKVKNDPRLVAAARELKDRWLEEINSGRYLPMGNGKYDVTRRIDGSEPGQSPFLIEERSIAA